MGETTSSIAGVKVYLFWRRVSSGELSTQNCPFGPFLVEDGAEVATANTIVYRKIHFILHIITLFKKDSEDQDGWSTSELIQLLDDELVVSKRWCLSHDLDFLDLNSTANDLKPMMILYRGRYKKQALTSYVWECLGSITQRIHVWNIYQHLPQKSPKCR